MVKITPELILHGFLNVKKCQLGLKYFGSLRSDSFIGQFKFKLFLNLWHHAWLFSAKSPWFIEVLLHVSR